MAMTDQSPRRSDQANSASIGSSSSTRWVPHEYVAISGVAATMAAASTARSFVPLSTSKVMTRTAMATAAVNRRAHADERVGVEQTRDRAPGRVVLEEARARADGGQHLEHVLEQVLRRAHYPEHEAARGGSGEHRPPPPPQHQQSHRPLDELDRDGRA